MITIGYKVFSHQFGSPIQGGEPIWSGHVPFDLPVVEVETSERECAAGWNACRDTATALRIAGLWGDGWPARLARVETSEPVVERGNKLRASTWTVTEWLPIESAIRELSAVFGEYADEMAEEQIAWHRALGRPDRNEAAVVAGLQAALSVRNLDWSWVRFGATSEAWAASEAWNVSDAWTASEASEAWTASDTWAAWTARAASDATAASDAWAARTASAAWAVRTAWDARVPRAAMAAIAARVAWDALIVQFAARMDWVAHPSDYLTTGIRDAYANGLAVALPTGQGKLGWAMMVAP